VGRYFDGFQEALSMKRWRCPECGAVHTVRPSSHWRGFWAGVEMILSSLKAKLAGERWLPQVSRQRQQYWWRGYQLQRHLRGRPAPWTELLRQQVILATHSLRFRCLRGMAEDPHRIFAVTPPLGLG
jgi:ribosomal protein S27AE